MNNRTRVRVLHVILSQYIYTQKTNLEKKTIINNYIIYKMPKLMFV